MSEAAEVLLSNRQFLYTFIGRAFVSEPDDDLLATVLNSHTEKECALLDDDKGEGERLWNALVAATSKTDRERLCGEYTKLFVGPTKLPAPPWESVYVNGEPLIFQESTLAVRQAYRSAGFQAARYPHEADDHVAIELDFMAQLSAKTCSAQANGDAGCMRELLERQAAFLDEHLLKWIDVFAKRLTEYDKVGEFYPTFAQLAALVCRRDRDVVRELLSV